MHLLVSQLRVKICDHCTTSKRAVCKSLQLLWASSREPSLSQHLPPWNIPRQKSTSGDHEPTGVFQTKHKSTSDRQKPPPALSCQRNPVLVLAAHLNSSSTNLGSTQGSVAAQTRNAHPRASDSASRTNLSNARIVSTVESSSLPHSTRQQA